MSVETAGPIVDISTGAVNKSGDALALRSSNSLSRVPAERAAAPSAPQVSQPVNAPAEAGRGDPLPPAETMAGATRTNWIFGAAAVLAGLGWIMERRQRRMLEMEKDSVLWAGVQAPGSSIMTTAGGLDDILPDSPDPAEAARTIYVTAIGETNSRREATLIDLHQLHGKLQRRRERGDNVAALLLLQQHLVDFRYTSPWVFLELKELYKLLDRQAEWDIARDAFRHRFGQNAPHWASPSTERAEFIADQQLCKELSRHWPYREARMFVLRWMLGDPDMKQKASGPALLGLGVYRDMMWIDEVLDAVLVARPRVVDSLL